MSDFILDIRKEQITKLTSVADVSDEVAARFDDLLEAYGDAKWDFGDRLYTSFGEGLYEFNVSIWGPWDGRYSIMVYPNSDLDSRWVEETYEACGMLDASIGAREVIEGWLAHILTEPDTELMEAAKNSGPVPVPGVLDRWDISIDKDAGEIRFGGRKS